MRTDTMTNIELTPEELAGIKANRKEKELLEKKQHATRLAEYATYKAKLERRADALNKLTDDLVTEAPELFSTSTTNRPITYEESYLDNYIVTTRRPYFLLGDVTVTIAIEEHVVHTKGSHRGASRGTKYLLNGHYNDYKYQWYKTAKAVTKAVQKIIDLKIRTEENYKNQKDLISRALTKAIAEFPQAKSVSKDYEYRGTASNRHRQEIIKVEVEKGALHYIAAEKDGEVFLHCFNFVMHTDFRKAVIEMMKS